jgi:hypothetical protein
MIVTELTASLVGTANLISIKCIGYSAGLWMIGGKNSSTNNNQAWLNSWDGAIFSDLSANLPNYGSRTEMSNIVHNGSLWLFGLNNSTFVTFDGAATWSAYTAGITQLPVYRPGNSIYSAWTGMFWVFDYGCVVMWDGVNWYDITSVVLDIRSLASYIGISRCVLYDGGAMYLFQSSPVPGDLMMQCVVIDDIDSIPSKVNQNIYKEAVM